MIEHPLPQNITSYQFHLVGNMTVKQFLILLVGAGVGFLFYSTNLPTVIKWFFIIFFALLAAATAFVPYESRTLDQWIVHFIRAIYRPTKYFWTRKRETPDFFDFTQRSDLKNSQSQPDLAPYKREQVQRYLASLGSSAVAEVNDPLDLFSNERNKVTNLFDQIQVATTPSAPEKESNNVTKPNLQVRARPLRPRKVVFNQQSTSTPASAPVSIPQQHSSAFNPAVSIPDIAPKKPAPTEQKESIIHVQKDKALPISVQPTTQQEVVEAPVLATNQTAPEAYQAAQTNAVTDSHGWEPVHFSKDLPFPSLPDKPNMLVGMVHDHDRHILAGTIVEILDESENTVRAMKTNALGQFYISSPLPNGKYHIQTEKDDLVFPIYSLEAKGDNLLPIDVEAKTTLNTQTASSTPQSVSPATPTPPQTALQAA